MASEPLGYFLTWTTYGSWLPGDERGWIKYQKGWHAPDVMRELESTDRMTENACFLGETARQLVEQQISETCLLRRWALHTVNCRSNHVHAVVSATDAMPRKVLSTLKSWTTRRLKSQVDPMRQHWWSERGSTRPLADERSLEAAIVYVLEGQDRNKQRFPGKS